MKTFFIIFVLSSVLLFTGGCTNNSMDTMNAIPQNYPIEITGIDFSLPEGCVWTFVGEKEQVYIINSQEELISYISCQEDNMPEINFELYSLIHVRGTTTNTVGDVTTQLHQTSINEYELNVDVTLGMGMLPEGWRVLILTPKLPQDAILKLYVNSAIKGDFFPQWICSPDENVMISLSFNKKEQVQKSNSCRLFSLSFALRLLLS
jgi:hypothetical protein